MMIYVHACIHTHAHKHMHICNICIHSLLLIYTHSQHYDNKITIKKNIIVPCTTSGESGEPFVIEDKHYSYPLGGAYEKPLAGRMV